MDLEATKRSIEDLVGGRPPSWVVVCGSGIGAGLVSEPAMGLTITRTVGLAELGLPAPAVAGHGHALVFGDVGRVPVCLQTGRLHPYEGHAVGTCTAALSALLACGATGVVLTCAVGALRADLQAGQLVLVSDQINLLGPTPLVGPRFIDCSRLYTPGLRRRLQEIASGRGEAVEEAVYIHARGPQYETPAETEALRRLGGEVVGMSTTYEALVAAAAGAALAGIGVVTNAAGAAELSHEEVQAQSLAARARLAGLLGPLLARTPTEIP